MHILVVSQYFWPENFRINDLVTEFCSRGHQVTVLTGCPNYPAGKIFPEFRQNPESFERFGNAKIVRVPMISRGQGALHLALNYVSFALSATVLGGWRLRKENFDIIFACQLSPVTSVLPAIFLRYLKKRPIVLWVLDLWPESLEAIGVIRSPRILKFVGLLVKYIYDHSNLILAQSRSFIPKIQQYCRPGKRINYFPSWSDVQFDFTQTIPAKEILHVDGLFNVMFAGNIGDAQDFPAILDAAERLKDEKAIRWLIVGDGRCAEWVRSEIARRGLSHCFLMLGRYSLDRMPSFYMHADALLVSLRNEPTFNLTIPGKLQSYLSSGIPVVAMLNGEGADIVRNSGAGLCCPAGDGSALAAAVQKLSFMSIFDRNVMGARGLDVSKQEFDKALLISRLLSWFDDQLASS